MTFLEIARSIALIRTFIRNNSDRDGFIACGDICEAVKGAELVLEKARLVFDKSKTMHAFDLAVCIIHEMLGLLGRIEDTDAVVEETIDECLAFIDEIIEDEELNPLHKESLFNKLMEEASHRRYNDWDDWRLDLLSSCTMLADSPALRIKLDNHLVAMISNEKGDSWSTKHFAEKINLIRYRLIKQYDRPKKAREFIEQNIKYSRFRKMALESALQEKIITW